MLEFAGQNHVVHARPPPQLPCRLAALAWALALLRLPGRALADLNFDRFSHDPRGLASSIRLIGGAEIDLYSTEFAETCIPDPAPQSLTALARGPYQAPPCRGDEAELDDGNFPGQRRYTICAPGPCSNDTDCPTPTTGTAQPRCSYWQQSTGLNFCVLECQSDADCGTGVDGDTRQCRSGQCMASTNVRNMSAPRTGTQRFQFPQRRNDPMYNKLPNNTYLDDGQLDNPYAGRVQKGNYTEVWVTKEFVPDGDLLTVPHNRTQLCHYALRLTPPKRALNTAAWSKFKQLVVYGFVTEFHFQVLHRTKECIVAGDASEWCTEAGADGFAFVIQNHNRKIVGTEVGGIGYAFPRSLVVEFDMYRDLEFGDPTANHISVMIPSRLGQPNTANHATSQVAYTSDIPLLQEGTHEVRIEYDNQNFKWDDLGRDYDAFMDRTFLKQQSTGRLGLFSVWLDGQRVLALPLDIVQIVQPDGTATAQADPPMQPNSSAYDELGETPGRAWVGFTSSTNYGQFQSVDIISWKYQEFFACPNEDVGRYAYCDVAWSPNPPVPPVSVATYSVTPVGTSTPCSYDGALLCSVPVQNAARLPIMISSLTPFNRPGQGVPCIDGMLQWNHMHPHFLGCSRYVYFTQAVQELWITTLDGSRSVVVSDNSILQKAPAVFKRRNPADADNPWKYCVREHASDPALLSFAECNCAYCVRQLDIEASYAVFYQHQCSNRFGLECPCFEASESQHDSSTWVFQEPLKYMRVHICRGCAYNSHCSMMLKVAVCEDSYQTYYIGNPLAPTILANGFTDMLRDQGRVTNGQIRGDACNCEPEVRPYQGGDGQAGICQESLDLSVETAPVSDFNACADQCRGAARCNYFIYWGSSPWTGTCVLFTTCIWVACNDFIDDLQPRCLAGVVYQLGPLGPYTDAQGEVQTFAVFPIRTLQTNFLDCKQCLHLYEPQYCHAQCGYASYVPYTHWPAGQLCGTCIFAGNRMHEMTDAQTQTVKDCVYQAIRDSRDPWVRCNATAWEQGGAYALDLFNGVSTHYLSECPGKPFPDNGAVCVPNLYASQSFPLQVLSRMAAINDTVWDDQLQCLNAQCRLLAKDQCYRKLATFSFGTSGSYNDDSGNITGIGNGVPLPTATGGVLYLQKEVDGFSSTRQYVYTSPLPYNLENYTLEGWVQVGSREAVTDIAYGKSVESTAPWSDDYLPYFAVDGDMTTYWSSQLGKIGTTTLLATWTCDLGQLRYSGAVQIYWKEPAADYSLAVRSTATDDWRTIVQVAANRDTVTYHDVFFQARWVQLKVTRAAATRPNLYTMDDFKGGWTPSRFPAVSMYEFQVLKDDQISRLKPSYSSQVWDRPIALALDGDLQTYWATEPGATRADFLVDFGSSLTINVLRVMFKYKPTLVQIVKSTQPCGTCPWVETTATDNFLQCRDGTLINASDINVGGWDGCNLPPPRNRGGRVRCPPNYPLMCQGQCDTSGNSGDWCCWDDCYDYGGPRVCTPEDGLPVATPLDSRVGEQVTDEITLTSTYQIRCLRVQVDSTALVYGERLLGVTEVQAYNEANNIATLVSGAYPLSTIPSDLITKGESRWAVDGDPSTNWLVTPNVDGYVELVLDLGQAKWVMSLEVIFATSPTGQEYKASTFSISLGITLAALAPVDQVSGFFQMSRKVLLGLRQARYVKLAVTRTFASNPSGKFGLQDIRVYAASDNLCQRNTSTGFASSSWAEAPGTQYQVFDSGDYYPHAPAMALDNDPDTWWGATYGVSGIPGVGAGAAMYEIILGDPPLLSLMAIRWRFPAIEATVWCATDMTTPFLQVGALFSNADYVTPIVFLGSRKCKKVRIMLGRPLVMYAGEGVIGIREVELYNFQVDRAFSRPSIDSNDASGALAVDSDTVSRWTSASNKPTNFTVDLGEPAKAVWGVRLLMPSSAPAKGFQLAIANSSNADNAWASDSDYIVVATYGANFNADLYIITRFTARYVRVIFLSTPYASFSLRMMQVFGGTNFAYNQIAVAPMSWNHSASQTVDGNASTFWLAEPFATAVRLRVDLAESYFIAGGISINWKFAAQDFSVVISNDLASWQSIYTVTGNLDNNTRIGVCFEARYVELRMTRPSRLNGDGAYAIYSLGVQFDSNIAHCKNVTVTHNINNSLFVKENANDGNPTTIWMPAQGATNASLTMNLQDNMIISGFYLSWRYPPTIFQVYYQDPDNLTNWVFVNQWGPPDLPTGDVGLTQTWSSGWPARRIKIQILDTKRYDEGRLCALRETLIYYPSDVNLVIKRNITTDSYSGENVPTSANDGNERGTYWKAQATVLKAYLLVELDRLVTPPGGPPAGHDIGRVWVLWRFAPGFWFVELFYDTTWTTVHQEFGTSSPLMISQFALNMKATRIKLTVSAADPKNPLIGVMEFKAFRTASMRPPAMETSDPPWAASPSAAIDTMNSLSMQSNLETYWMSPHSTDFAEVVLDLYKEYMVFDLSVYFGFKPQVVSCWRATSLSGPWTEAVLTSGDINGLLSLANLGESFPMRFLKVKITKGYRDVEGLLGTSIRDIGVYLFRNWARNTSAVADTVWDYPPSAIVDGDNTTRWVSRFNTQQAELIVDLGTALNVAGLSWQFQWGAGYYQLSYKYNASDDWTDSVSNTGKFDGVVELDSTLQFKARYLKLLMQYPLVRIYDPDNPGADNSDRPVFSVVDFRVKEHPGGGGVFGLQSLDGLQYTTFAYGLREPGQWVLASEREIFTRDLGQPPDFKFNTWMHLAATFETVSSAGKVRTTRVKTYRNGRPYGPTFDIPQAVDRLSVPNQTRLVFGIRSTAHAVPNANAWPPSQSSLPNNLKENPNAKSWPGSSDPVKHGASHSPYFDGQIRRVSLIKNALSDVEVRGLYLGLELGCHCYDACPTGSNRFFPQVQVPCSGQGVCRRPLSGPAGTPGYCQCLPGYSGTSCQNHCSVLSKYGCCEVDDDCPPSIACNNRTKACAV